MAAGATTKRRSRDGAQGAATPSAELIDRVEERVLWLAVRMIHEANVVRPNPDGLKVGGHQASSASVASILTDAATCAGCGPTTCVAVKPHASPALPRAAST